MFVYFAKIIQRKSVKFLRNLLEVELKGNSCPPLCRLTVHLRDNLYKPLVIAIEKFTCI